MGTFINMTTLRNKFAIIYLIKFNHNFSKNIWMDPCHIKHSTFYYFPRFLKKDAYISTVASQELKEFFVFFFYIFIINKLRAFKLKISRKLITTRIAPASLTTILELKLWPKTLKIGWLLWLARGTGLKKLGLQTLS